MKLLRNKLFSFTFIAVLLGGAIVFSSSYFANGETSVVEIEGNPIADFSDKRNLVGATDHVFLGKVTSLEGQIDAHLPISQFNVEVLEEIKGNFEQNQVVIGQYGGYDTDENGEKVFVKFRYDNLLEVNKTYIFAANEQEDGSLLIIPVHGNVELKDNNEKEKLKREFLDAYKNEKIPDAIKKKIEQGSK